MSGAAYGRELYLELRLLVTRGCHVPSSSRRRDLRVRARELLRGGAREKSEGREGGGREASRGRREGKREGRGKGRRQSGRKESGRDVANGREQREGE